MLNLVPAEPGTTPSYWCTWIAQNHFWYARTDEEYAAVMRAPAPEGVNLVRDFLTEKTVFGDPGWATNPWSAIRGDLFFCFDDGWDVPLRVPLPGEGWRFGSLELNEARFPGIKGTPVERLTRLNERIRELGWRGAAVWVAAQCAGDGKDKILLDDAACDRYWRERMAWSARAGINYWKLDWGKRAFDNAFRRRLTEIARQEAPNLIIEHARVMGPLNNITGNCRFAGYTGELADSLEYLSFSDALRSYDEVDELRVPVALDRITTWLMRGRVESPARGIINCEDNVYLGAGLGCSLGIMRVPVRGPHTQWQWPRMDEAIRAVRWQRLAPAFGVKAGETVVSQLELHDTHAIDAKHWYGDASGKTITQSAPAITARGMALPVVRAHGEHPYVVAARNPNGASSIAVLPRFLHGALVLPVCAVEMRAGQLNAPVGIFGRYRSLTIHFEQPLGPAKIWAQDIKANTAHDITGRVTVQNNSLVLPGELIDEIGLSSATECDPSDPGLVLRVM